MKKHVFVILAAVLLSVTLASLASAGTALTAAEVKALVSGKTFTVSDAQINKETGEKDTFTIRAYEGGVIQEVDNPDSGQQEPRVWSVNENGSFCYSGKFTRRNRSVRHCGYIVPAGSGIYEMYELRMSPTKKKNIQNIVFPNKNTRLLFTFSNFK